MGQAGSANPPVDGAAPQENEPTWWCKFLAKGCGVAAGLAALIIGILNCFTVTPACLASAVILMCVGFMLIVLEAPCCCMFLDFIHPLSRFSDSRPHWQKAILYGLSAIFPVVMCFTLTKLLACGLVMATAAFYGMMTLGRKADRESMAVRARGGDREMKATLINNADVEDPLPK